MKPFLLLLVFAHFAVLTGHAQHVKPMMMKPKQPIICYAKHEDQHTVVPPPEAFRNGFAAGRTKTATINVEYIGFSAQAQAAFQHAVDIWETLISSDVEINVVAQWQALGSGVLGSAIWGSVHANFPGAQKLNVWYPAALAEKIAGEELNDADAPDIFANFSSEANWYYGTNGQPSPGQYDLVTVVLHELGHGLGFSDSFSVSGSNGTVGIGDQQVPIVFDLQLENNNGQNIFQNFDNGTADLRTQLTSNALFFNSPQVLAVNSGTRARVYAPSTFDTGSSIAHLNESTYPSGNDNSLMTPQIGAAEVIHDPGPITLAMFNDMGWRTTRIVHEPLPTVEEEEGPFVVTATITTDEAPISTPMLNYSTGGDFTEVPMTPTANPNEYTATIPSTGEPATYVYFISVEDNLSTTFTSPGKLVTNNGEEQFYYQFETGPDNEAPEILHAPVTFVSDLESELVIEATVEDNLGVGEVVVEYEINDVLQSPIVMVEDDGTYTASIDISNLEVGDIIEYRIEATDLAVAENSSSSPADGFHTVNVVGLGETIESYANDFNNPTDDFFGNGFSVSTPAGFDNGAVHSTHPYPTGTGFPNDQLNLIYQLKNPILVQSENAIIKFDEIALVEPGEAGVPFGEEEFWDYVVVEGSGDGGLTWSPLEDGYDARAHAAWLTKYNSSINNDNISTALGDPSLYRQREISLLEVFEAGDEVAIRFRLYSDPLAAGWGWAIDNLKIQIDDEAPEISHDFKDIVLPDEAIYPIRVQAEDEKGIKALAIEYSANGEATSLHQFAVVGDAFVYTFELGVAALEPGDYFSYRIIATDSSNNVAYLPAEGFLDVTVFEPEAPIAEYANNFDAPTTDFIGNYFDVITPSGFTSGAIHSPHPYPVGFGLHDTTNFHFMLTKPITVNGNNPYIQFKEIVIVEGHPASAAFGTPEFKDFVAVEGSVDNGATWIPFADGYDASALALWNSAFNNGSAINPSFYRTRTIKMDESGVFADGDNVLIRFRLFSDATVSGWGWAIDDLYIQGAVTSLETTADASVAVFPNPVDREIGVSVITSTPGPVELSLLTIQGAPVHFERGQPANGRFETTVDVSGLSSGMYLVKVSTGGKVVTRKVFKQ